MHGGMKTYRGSAVGARTYVEAGLARADDYYLAEGAGIAERYAAAPDDGVRRLAPLSGDEYEAWVAGFDPVTGEAKGRLRRDASAVRFVEVVVNGPKSWSLAAELHPEISVAYDAAQDRAAEQIVGWLARHATTRVGPRGAQIQVPVTELEAAVVRHRTSRAGDPHRHLHLQINARVFAEGRWRGLHTVGVRDSLDAINGIGHAAVMTDPAFRAALAEHGYTLDAGTGEVAQLSDFVGPFSARAAQIGRNVDRYEAGWRAANPGREPGPRLYRAWDARAWADARPDKVVPRDGAELTRRWSTELRELGFRAPTQPLLLLAHSVGRLDRDNAVKDVMARLAARRSGWNAADIRGEVEQLIARADVVTSAAVRGELAEDLTARTVARCVPLLQRSGVPEHVRAMTSPHVLEVEHDVVTRLSARGTAPRTAPTATATATATDESRALDLAQQRAVDLLASDARLVVVEGAAGAGKTATLAAARVAIECDGRRLVVVTPTRKAAQVAAGELGTSAFSAAWLVHQHGFRWDGHGTWSRLILGDIDPATGAVYTGPSVTARLRRGDVLLCDEAGMLDQDSARALLTLADEHDVRVALLGDRHQLPAVGRGGVLDLAVRWALPAAQHTLDTVHRFVQTTTRPDGTVTLTADDEYARLSLAMRGGEDPAGVFDALVARGQLVVYASQQERLAALAATAAAAVRTGSRAVLVADTREQVAALNAAVRDALVTASAVEDTHAVTTRSGQRIGVGDRVATRRNDTDLDVANRDSWTVRSVHQDGAVSLSGERGVRTLNADYVRENVELAYASTVHGVQGDTVTAAHLVVGEHTSAAAAYVGMTRGRECNTAHLVADSREDAREQWVAVFARDRADLGPAHAARLAAAEAERYVRLPPLEDVLDDLRAAWTVQAGAESRLEGLLRRRDLLRDIVTLTERRDTDLPPLRRAHDDARTAAQTTAATLRQLEPIVTARADEQAAALTAAWDAQRQPARDAAGVVRDGAGRFGQRRAAVRQAHAHLVEWAAAWRPYLPAIPSDAGQVVAFAGWFDDAARHHENLRAHARQSAEHNHPDYLAARDAEQHAEQSKAAAWSLLRQAEQHYSIALQHYGSLGQVDDPAERLADAETAVASEESTLTAARARISALRADPALRAQPGDVVKLARGDWQADRDHAAALRELRWAAQADRERATIGPRGAGRGTVLEIHHDAPDRGISR